MGDDEGPLPPGHVPGSLADADHPAMGFVVSGGWIHTLTYGLDSARNIMDPAEICKAIRWLGRAAQVVGASDYGFVPQASTHGAPRS